MVQKRSEQRGAALAAVIISSIVFSIAAFAMLSVSLSQRQRTKQFDVDRMRARYAAEAGVVWAREQLWREAITGWPPGCPNGGTATLAPPPPFNIVNGLAVQVTITNCGAGNDHQVTATVNY